MEEFKKELAKHLSKFLTENDLWLTALIIVGIAVSLMVLGGVLTWLWKGKKLLAESKKAEDELAQNKLDRLEKAYEYDDEVELNTQLLSQALKDVITEIQNDDKDEVIKKREEALDVFFYQYLKSFERYIEVKKLILEKAYRRPFIKLEVLPVLDNIYNFLNSINIPELTTKIGKSEAKLHNSSIDSIYSSAKSSLPFGSFYLRYQMKTRIEKIKEYGY